MVKGIVLGDIGGHAAPLKNTLESLHVDLVNNTIPDDMHIIQVGDLVHKGPDTDEVVSIVDKLLPTGQWTQLLGNHEMMHYYPPKFYACNCSSETQHTMNRWLAENQVKIATAFTVEPHKFLSTDTVLLTHAGIPSLFYRQYGSVVPLSEFVQQLNKDRLSDYVNRSGIMLSGPRFMPTPDWKTGPIWAHCVEEVYSSWADMDMPFDQIHGHTSPFNFASHAWWQNVSKHWRKKINVYQENTAFTVHKRDNQGSFISVDPGFEKTAHLPIMPYFAIDIINHIT